MVALWLLSHDTAALANGRAEKESEITGESARFKSDAQKVLIFRRHRRSDIDLPLLQMSHAEPLAETVFS